MTAFSLILAWSAAMGLAWLMLQAPPGRLAAHADRGLGALAGLLLGGRLGFVILNWAYYGRHPGAIFAWSEGGFSGGGAALGALLGLALVAAVQRVTLLAALTATLPLAASVIVGAWLGCWQSGCAYGWPAPWGLPAPDEAGVRLTRLPVQLVGALLALGWLALLDAGKARLGADARRVGLAWIGWGLILFGMSFGRADPTLMVRGLRLDAWFGLTAASAGAALMLVQGVWTRSRRQV